MFYTGSGREIQFQDIPRALLEYYQKNKHYDSPFSLIVGADSQDYADRKAKNKLVVAVVFSAVGHGGIFFTETEYVPLMHSVRAKLHKETEKSLATADGLLELLTSDPEFEDMYLNTSFSLNIDAGYEDSEYRDPKTHSKTEPLIPELIAWVNAMGYDAHVKPDSIAASCVADRVSK